MPIHISNDLKEWIVLWYYTDNKTMEEVRDLSRCSISLISNVLRNYREYGEVQNPFTQKASGCPCVLNDDDISFIQTLIDAHPSLYLDEIQQKLFDISYQRSQGLQAPSQPSRKL
jgi:transposase